MKKLIHFNSLKQKLLFGFLIVIFLVVLLGSYNLIVINKMNKQTKGMINNEVQLVIANEQMAKSMSNRIGAARGYLMYGGNYKDQFNENIDISKQYEKVIKEIGDNKEFDQLMIRAEKWSEFIGEKVFQEYEQGSDVIARNNLASQMLEGQEIMAGYEDLAIGAQELIDKRGQEIINNGHTNIIIVIILVIVTIILSVAVSIISANKISNPVNQLMKRMKLIAQGDLSHEPLEYADRDEVGQLVTAANEMNHNIRALLEEINSVSETIASRSEEMTQSANEVKAGSQQVAATMHELSKGSDSQARSASELASTMASFSTVVQEASENGDRIEAASTKVLKMTNEGSQLMDASYEQMIKIDAIMKDAVKKVQGLDHKSQEISKLVSVIKDIAEQTNLLALNAAIESARAGEHGRGFAVVADEVRKLAEQVTSSVANITNIVSGIQGESSLVTDSLQNGYGEMIQGTNQIKTTRETFGEISTAVVDMATSIQTVSENLLAISSDSELMSKSISEIAAISEESAAGVEETSASSQQTSSSMEEVAYSSEDLAKQAEKLQELVLQFKL